MNTWNYTSKNESKVPSARYKRHSATEETKQAIVCLIQASEHLNKTCVMPELTVSPYGYNIRLQRTNTTGTELNARRLCQAGRLCERDVARIYRNVACSDSCQPFNRADSLRFSRSAAATYPRSTTGKKDEQRMMKRVKRLPAGARSFMTIFGYTWSRVAWRIRCCFPLRWKITWSVVRHLPRPFSFLPADRLSPIDMRVLKTSAERENSSLFFALFRYEVTDKRSNSYRQV